MIYLSVIDIPMNRVVLKGYKCNIIYHMTAFDNYKKLNNGFINNSCYKVSKCYGSPAKP